MSLEAARGPGRLPWGVAAQAPGMWEGQGMGHGVVEVRLGPRAKRQEGPVGQRGREMETPGKRERQGPRSFLKETFSPCFHRGSQGWGTLPRAL